ncbi:phosphoribosyltransferase family protein [Lacibacter sp. H375]|uniref:phosphoribosyltransferase n=1 Tax=Lacibacter sp. H375 TaxID=3133424 RepID=UPI0030BC27AD
MTFNDRMDAGLQLAFKLKKYVIDPCVVLAVPRGGVPVAYTVASELNFPMQLVLTKKIGHPINKEYAIGAASLSDYFVIPHDDVTEVYIQQEVKRVQDKLKDMQQKFMGDRTILPLKGKTVIIVDDGIATGNTMLATLKVIRKEEPEKIIIAVPVTSAEAYKKLAKETDEFICLLIAEEFYGVGAFYDDFKQVTDEDVKTYINNLQQKEKFY